MIALERMPGTLHGSSAFVIGYGRIGKLLADRLRAACAEGRSESLLPGKA